MHRRVCICVSTTTERNELVYFLVCVSLYAVRLEPERKLKTCESSLNLFTSRVMNITRNYVHPNRQTHTGAMRVTLPCARVRHFQFIYNRRSTHFIHIELCCMNCVPSREMISFDLGQIMYYCNSADLLSQCEEETWNWKFHYIPTLLLCC